MSYTHTHTIDTIRILSALSAISFRCIGNILHFSIPWLGTAYYVLYKNASETRVKKNNKFLFTSKSIPKFLYLQFDRKMLLGLGWIYSNLTCWLMFVYIFSFVIQRKKKLFFSLLHTPRAYVWHRCIFFLLNFTLGQ